jgi:hypothetical protein
MCIGSFAVTSERDDEHGTGYECSHCASVAGGPGKWQKHRGVSDVSRCCGPQRSLGVESTRRSHTMHSILCSYLTRRLRALRSISVHAILAAKLIRVGQSFQTESTIVVDDAVPIDRASSGSDEGSAVPAAVGVRRARGKCHGYRMDFASALLFVIGSIFYVELAIEGYIYARHVQSVPLSVLMADDDATWISYRLEERYNATLSSSGGTTALAAAAGKLVRALVAAGDDSVAAGDDSVSVGAGDDSVTHGDDFVSYDDDLVFQVGSSEVWVSQYQIIYFIAAFCFAMAGLLDIIVDKQMCHLFRYFGGTIGVASACTISSDELLSSIFSAVSVHLFMLDALAMLWKNKTGATTTMISDSMNICIIVGASSYLGGTIIDVVVSAHCSIFSNDAFSLYFAPLLNNYVIASIRFPTFGFLTTRSTGTYQQRLLQFSQPHCGWFALCVTWPIVLLL